VDHSLNGLLSAQRALESRFADFRLALDRRDEPAYRLGLADFLGCLVSWTQGEEQALLPAISRAQIPGPDPQRELKLEFVQLRELTRILMSLVGDREKLADLLGLTENLGRRLAAHGVGVSEVNYPAAAANLTEEDWTVLSGAAPTD